MVTGLMLAGLMVAGSPPAAAFDQCPQPQFGVGGISIDVTATTAAEAQTNGITEAASVGFRRMLDRLLRSDEAVEAFLSDANTSQFVDFYHISEENSLEGRYIAVLDYCFDAPRLRAAFPDLFTRYFNAYLTQE